MSAGLRGRPRKPSVEKERAGTARKHRTPQHETERVAALPDPPAHLDEDEARTWREIGGLLLDRRVMTAGDAVALEALAVAYVEWRRAREVLRELGTTYDLATKTGSVMHYPRPEVAQRDDAWRRVMVGCSHFGLTPATSAKAVPVSAKENQDGREATILSLVR